MPRISEISMTPLMDLTFLLLITFIITYPLMEQGIPVNLPQGKAKQLSADKALTITIDREGQVFLDSNQIESGQLAVSVRAFAASDPTVTVLVRADSDVRYAAVVDVLKILHDAKITKMALVTQAEE